MMKQLRTDSFKLILLFIMVLFFITPMLQPAIHLFCLRDNRIFITQQANLYGWSDEEKESYESNQIEYNNLIAENAFAHLIVQHKFYVAAISIFSCLTLYHIWGTLKRKKEEIRREQIRRRKLIRRKQRRNRR